MIESIKYGCFINNIRSRLNDVDHYRLTPPFYFIVPAISTRQRALTILALPLQATNLSHVEYADKFLRGERQRLWVH
ncbi:MAG: hypothetical protein ACI8VC_001987 [Candidatus Endobugula sp.]|jgi:hypothetical protein